MLLLLYLLFIFLDWGVGFVFVKLYEGFLDFNIFKGGEILSGVMECERGNVIELVVYV